MTGILALVLAAHAFAPTDEVWVGKEPSRLFRTHLTTQLRLRHQPTWVEFTQGEGRGWQARFDERTGSPHRMWGPGLALGALTDERAVRRGLEAFFSRNRALLGVSPSELAFVRAKYVAHNDTWVVDYDRTVGGAPIWRAGVTARIKAGKLIMLGVDTYPGARVPQAELSAAEAAEVAQLEGPAALADHQDVTSRLVVLPLDVPGGVDLHLAWEVRSRTVAPRGDWVTFVDAATGELLSVHNEVRFLEGTVYAEHPTRTLDGARSTSPVPLALVTGDSTTYTTATGTYSVDGASATTELRGSYLTVRNYDGDEGALTFSDADPTWTTASATEAEIASYVFLHQVRDWALGVAPDLGMSTDALVSYVNRTDGNCNAYYDGNVNFYAEGGGCNNTGSIGDVNYHEWGHGFHYYAAASWSLDGSVGEGVGDSVAILQTHDSTIAPYFVPSGSGIREVATNQVYPDDVVNEVHYDGLIFGGAVWDLWEELLGTYGEARADEGVAHALVGRLLADALRGNPTLESAYDEFVVADDDDGDLANGTPHFCEIAEAFALHGLGPLAFEGGALAVDHAPLDNQTSGAGITVTGEVVNLASACAEFTLGSVELRYSTDGGSTWETAAGTLSGSTFEAEFPDLPGGTVVHYYLVGVGTDGTEATAPTVGEIAPFSFYVGELTEVWCTDLQDDGGLTHELISGEEREGADDWTHEVPSGMADDPDAAYTGRRVWGNDLGGGNYNGEYQPGVHNRLSTPAIDVQGESALVVQYRRWLNVEDGYYDHARVLANGEELWANHESGRQQGDEHTEDDQWMLATHLAEPATDGTLTIAWEIESDDGLEFGGWNLDDICVYAPADAVLQPDVSDFSASDDQVGQVTLSWTQPADEGATSAVVVRREDRYGTGVEDGDVVATLTGLTPGAAATAVDPFVGHGYYTVLVGNDDGFSHGAVAGANADEGTGLAADGDGPGDSAGDEVVLTGADCGCASGAGASPLALGAVAAVALAARRRRS